MWLSSTIKALEFLKIYRSNSADLTFAIIVFSIIVFQLIGNASYIFYAWDKLHGPNAKIFSNIGAGINMLIAFYIMLITLLKVESVRNVKRNADEIERHEFASKPSAATVSGDVRVKWLKKSLIIQMLFLSMSSFKHSESGEMVYGFNYNIYYGFNITFTPLRQIFAILQVLIPLYQINSCILVANLFVTSIEFLLYALNNLDYQLRSLKNISSYSGRRQQLKKCVEYHIKIIDMATHLQQNSSAILYYAYIWPVTIVFVLLSMVDDYNNMSWGIPVCTFNWIAMHLVYHFGQKLIDKSTLISEAAYDAMPFDGDYKFCKDLMIVSMRAQKPLVIKLGAFGVLNNATFLKMLKFGYTFMACLLSTRAKN